MFEKLYWFLTQQSTIYVAEFSSCSLNSWSDENVKDIAVITRGFMNSSVIRPTLRLSNRKKRQNGEFRWLVLARIFVVS
jgi:hypothetical protein